MKEPSKEYNESDLSLSQIPPERHQIPVKLALIKVVCGEPPVQEETVHTPAIEICMKILGECVTYLLTIVRTIVTTIFVYRVTHDLDSYIMLH